MKNPSVVHGLFYGPYPTVQRSHPAYPKVLCKCPRHSKSQNLLLNQETLHPECHPRMYSQASGLFNTSMIYRPFTFTNLGRKCTFVPPRKLPCLVPRSHNPCVIKSFIPKVTHMLMVFRDWNKWIEIMDRRTGKIKEVWEGKEPSPLLTENNMIFM